MNFRSHLVINYLNTLIDNGYQAEFAREFDRNLPTIQGVISENTDKKVLEVTQKIIESRKKQLTNKRKR